MAAISCTQPAAATHHFGAETQLPLKGDLLAGQAGGGDGSGAAKSSLAADPTMAACLRGGGGGAPGGGGGELGDAPLAILTNGHAHGLERYGVPVYRGVTLATMMRVEKTCNET